VKVVIDAATCTGHGRCYTLAPHLFDADDRGLGLVIGDGEVAPELEKEARSAVSNCPERAISLEE
jgi:ferredoxin